ncbi:MAG TPA: BrnA antitoxin family protein [Burkholderiaceae bacterium]|nr:BrnA antitoxin family protein [Burkholderiaceae bacterium]
MPKLKPGTILPTPEEDIRIDRGIAADPDAMEFGEQEAHHARRMGRPPLAAPKIAVTVRYDQDVLDAFRATGDGWQTRMNAALREWLRDHKAA